MTTPDPSAAPPGIPPILEHAIAAEVERQLRRALADQGIGQPPSGPALTPLQAHYAALHEHFEVMKGAGWTSQEALYFLALRA
jgi:hypothetical protein